MRILYSIHAKTNPGEVIEKGIIDVSAPKKPLPTVAASQYSYINSRLGEDRGLFVVFTCE